MRNRDWSEAISAAVSLALSAALAGFFVARVNLAPPPPPDDPDMTITMEDIAPDAPQTAEPPAAEPPAPVVTQPPDPPPPPLPPDATPPIDPPPPPPPPRPRARALLPPRPSPPHPAASLAAPASPVPRAVSTPALPSRAGIEATFVTRLHAYIKTITRYPTSKEARLQRPAGAVEVGFTLTRGGEVHAVVLTKASGSSVLDRQALSIVRSGSYPRIPDNAWIGASDHRFTVTVIFTPT